VILVEDGGGNEAQAVETLKHDPLWRRVPAVEHGRVYAHAGSWVSSVTQRRIPDLEAVAQLLHPEVGDL